MSDIYSAAWNTFTALMRRVKNHARAAFECHGRRTAFPNRRLITKFNSNTERGQMAASNGLSGNQWATMAMSWRVIWHLAVGGQRAEVPAGAAWKNLKFLPPRDAHRWTLFPVAPWLGADGNANCPKFTFCPPPMEKVPRTRSITLPCEVGHAAQFFMMLTCKTNPKLLRERRSDDFETTCE